MTQSSTDDYDLTFPPFTVEEMEVANAIIQIWQFAGTSIPDAPLASLLAAVIQTLETTRRLLNDLESPASHAISRTRKQKFVDAFREVLAIHAASTLDVAGLRAKGRSVRENLQAAGAEESEEESDWISLETLLGEKEELMQELKGKVDELEEQGEQQEEDRKGREVDGEGDGEMVGEVDGEVNEGGDEEL